MDDSDLRINDKIRAREVRLVDSEGNQLGIKPLPEAIYLAREADMDLVEVAPLADPPVCRILDYGKWKYEAAQREKESRRRSNATPVKEMKYRIKIGGSDFDTKTRKVSSFLDQGHKVKITIMFKGREQARPELGRKILDRIAEQLVPPAKVEAMPRLDGRNMTMVLAPDRRATKPKTKAAGSEGADSDGAASDPTTSDPGATPNGAVGTSDHQQDTNEGVADAVDESREAEQA